MEKKKYTNLSTESGTYRTTLNRMFNERKPWEPEDPRRILSFMPGTVEELNVKKGSKVKEGDSLLIFRAMKMNNNILSPLTGKIKSVNVKKGDNVSKDTLMIEFE